MLHIGHIRLLKRAKAWGSYLIVGVSSDQLNIQKKSRAPIYSLDNRVEILSSLRFVDEVFVEESLELKREYIIAKGADILTMGDDWQGKFDYLNDCCQVKYLTRTPSISTTEVIEVIRDNQ